MDRLAWNINYYTSRLGQSPRQSDSVLSFSDEVPVSQGQWGQATVAVDDTMTLDLYDAGGAEHLIVSSSQLLDIEVNDSHVYGTHLVLGLTEITGLKITPLGLPVDQGEITAVDSANKFTDADKQWRFGRALGNLATGTDWCDDEHSLDFILDVNGRLARILLAAPIGWGKGEDAGTGDAVAGYLNHLVDESIIGSGHVEFKWNEDHFEVDNLQGQGGPIIRPYLDNVVHWLARLGLYRPEEREALINPNGMRMRVTSGTHIGQEREILESEDPSSLEWAGSLGSLVQGDSYRILRTEEEATMEWLVVDRGAR